LIPFLIRPTEIRGVQPAQAAPAPIPNLSRMLGKTFSIYQDYPLKIKQEMSFPQTRGGTWTHVEIIFQLR
jgi:hypothetical protein